MIVSELTVTALTSIEAVDAVAGAWDELLERSRDPEIFLTHAWMRSWWEIFGGEGQRQLLVLLVHDGAELIGLAPFQVRPVSGLGPARLRRLEFLGTGEDEADEVCSDFLDVIAAAGREDDVCRAVWQYLSRAHRGVGGVVWDEAWFGKVLATSRLLRLLAPRVRGSGRALDSAAGGRALLCAPRRWQLRRLPAGAVLAAPQAHLLLPAQAGAGGRHRGAAGVRRRRHPDIPAGDRPAEPAAAQLAGQTVGVQQREVSAFPGAGGAPAVAARVAGPALVAEATAAASPPCTTFVYARVIYYYQSGWDTAAFGNVSPGLVFLSQAIESGFAQRQRRFDFLVGGDGSYKQDYECRTEPVRDLRVYNNTWTGQLVRSAREVKDLLRQVAARVHESS